MRRLILVLILCLAILPIVGARAQQSCTYYSDTFPTGWNILSGATEGNYVVGGSAVLVDSTPIKSARVYKAFSTSQFSQIGLYFGFWGAGSTTTTVSATLYRSNTAIATRTIVNDSSVHAGWFDPLILDFNGETGDGLQVWVYHPISGIRTDVALSMNVVCFGQVTTATPSPTIPIETDTPTPTNTLTPTPPTNTPTPSHTATASNTPTASYTPGGPTVTLAPSGTPAPTQRPGISSGGGLFASAPAPRGCADPFNPCGAMPFPVPPFATINLPSPTANPSITARATSTIIGTSTPGPTTTGTPSPSATGTYTTQESSVVSFATQIGGIAVSVNSTAVVFGSGGAGDPVDLRNGANEIGSYIGEFWGFTRAIQGLFLGRTGTLLAFLLLVGAFIVVVKVLVFIVPILLAIIRWILLIIETVTP